MIIGDRKFLEIPGDKVFELPPLIVSTKVKSRLVDGVLEAAAEVIKDDDLALTTWDEITNELELKIRRENMAMYLSESYIHMVAWWQWGDSILRWATQCEETFRRRPELRNILSGSIWPYDSRRRFVDLFKDKSLPEDGPELECAVGLRLIFRIRPRLSRFEGQHLLGLGTNSLITAYKTWANMDIKPDYFLPRERFSFRVIDLSG